MKHLYFKWDKRKETANIKKHGVSFEEARTTFFDEYAIVFHDPDHSEDEDRFILLGTSYKLNTLGCVPLFSRRGICHQNHLRQESR